MFWECMNVAKSTCKLAEIQCLEGSDCGKLKAPTMLQYTQQQHLVFLVISSLPFLVSFMIWEPLNKCVSSILSDKRASRCKHPSKWMNMVCSRPSRRHSFRPTICVAMEMPARIKMLNKKDMVLWVLWRICSGSNPVCCWNIYQHLPTTPEIACLLDRALDTCLARKPSGNVTCLDHHCLYQHDNNKQHSNKYNHK